MIKRGKKYCNLSELKVNVGETKLFLNKKITKMTEQFCHGDDTVGKCRLELW